jgi:hypothetical protein
VSTSPVLLTASVPAPRAIRAALYLRVSTRADKRDDDNTRQRKRQKVDNQPPPASAVLPNPRLGNRRRICR